MTTMCSNAKHIDSEESPRFGLVRTKSKQKKQNHHDPHSQNLGWKLHCNQDSYRIMVPML